MITGGCWYIFSFEVFNFSLLLLSAELLMTRQKWYFFPLPVFLIGISQPFNLYVYGLFLFFYILLRQVQMGKFEIKIICSLLIKMIGAGFLGLLLSAPFLAENINSYMTSPRVGGANSYFHALSSSPVFALNDRMQAGTNIMRLFSNNLNGNGWFFNGWRNFLEAPLYYCGLPCLLLTPQVFRSLNRKTGYFFGAFFIILILPVVFPYLRYSFWLFSGDYYRAYSFFVSFYLIFYSIPFKHWNTLFKMAN
jgi:hypothetical protein